MGCEGRLAMRGSAGLFGKLAFSESVRASLGGRTQLSPAATDSELPERKRVPARTDWTKKNLIVAIRDTGMLYNIPDKHEESKENSGRAEAEARTIGIPSSRCGAAAARQPCQAVQEVWQDGMSLRRRHRPRPSLLSFRDARSRKDTIVLRSAAAQEPSVSVPAKPPQAAGTSQRNNRAQSGAPGEGSARRRGLIQNRGGALLLWILGVARRLARSRRARQLGDFVAFWLQCYWTH
jgi:hypothetical protein